MASPRTAVKNRLIDAVSKFFIIKEKSVIMKRSWNYVLIILLVLFGTLYVLGTFFEGVHEYVQIVISPSADLWANLFASLIAVLFIDKIIHRARIQKNKQSIRYVKGRLLTTLLDIIRNSKAPSNWKEKLANPEYDWKQYINELYCASSWSVKNLENIIDCYGHLLEPEIMNDIFLLVSVLRAKIYDFSDALNKSVMFISESIKIIENHELLKYMGITMHWGKGEAPKIKLGKEKITVCDQNQLRYYSEWLDEAISFRDEYKEKYELKRMSERLDS